MMSRDAAKNKSSENLINGKLFNEVETISKALYVDKHTSRTSPSLGRSRSNSVDQTNVPESKSKHLSDDLSTKDKKSMWNWKPLKSLVHRHRRFSCCFSLDIHSIEGLPSKFNNLSLCVHWRRRDGEVVTSPMKVIDGVALFEEKLTHTCSVYGSRSGSHQSAKYEAKHFLLYAAVDNNPKLDLGKHRVDLTRLLPLTLEELEDEKSCGSWTTTFKLLGEGKGAIMNVSFGYMVLGDNVTPNNRNVLQLLDSKASSRVFVKSNKADGNTSLRRSGSFPVGQKQSVASTSSDDVNILFAVPSTRMSEFSDSVNILYRKFDEDKLDSTINVKHKIEVSAANDPIKQACYSPSPPSDGHKGEMRVGNESIYQACCSPSHTSEGHKIEVPANESEPVNPSVFSPSHPSEGHKGEMPAVNESIDQACCSPLHSSEGRKIEVPANESEPMNPFGCPPSVPFEANIVNESEGGELSFVEKGLEVLEKKTEVDEDEEKIVGEEGVESPDLVKAESIDGNTLREETDFSGDEGTIHDCNSEEKDVCTKDSLLEDLELVLSHVEELEKEGLETPEAVSQSGDQENLGGDKPSTVMLDGEDLSDSLADDFLSMLDMEEPYVPFHSDTEPESPRERLLREFQKEVEASGCSLFGFDIDEEYVEDYPCYAPTTSGWEEFSEDSETILLGQAHYPKIRAAVMEDLETQALMEEWGLDEKAFQSSPPHSTPGFGSPDDLPPIEPSELPPLGEGLGSCIQTKTGGFLRSMNPVLFRNTKSDGSLVMQVSSPIVIPAEKGSGVMDVLQRLASAGLEKLSMQANKLMPLEDITGKTMQQIACGAIPQLKASERPNLLHDEQKGCNTRSAGKKRAKGAASSRMTKKSNSSSAADDAELEYVCLEDLAPLAMDKIEALSVEGLRIQSGMSGDEAPSNIMAQTIGEFSTLEGKRTSPTGSVGLEGAVGLQLLNLEDHGIDNNDEDGLMGLSLKLDEWMKLDSGEVDEEQLSERTSKLLAAHHASSTDLNFLRGKQGKRRCGLLGNDFTVALMVQLRDPLRDYEPVGTPMLALIQVERIFIPPKPKIYCMVAEPRDCSDGDDDLEPDSKDENKLELKEEKAQEQDVIPQYKIHEVHVAGLQTEPGKKKLWGTAAQQQSGSRWLLANGMGKGNKSPFPKPKILTRSTLPASITSQSGDTLWSISARYHGSGAKWKELAALNPHIRNPNVILPNETIKLR